MEKRLLEDLVGNNCLQKEGLANYDMYLLAHQQLLWRIQRHEEEITRSGSMMFI